VRLYRLTIKAPPHNLPPRYNICPTDPVDVVTGRTTSYACTRLAKPYRNDPSYGIGILVSRPYLSTSKIYGFALIATLSTMR
jgi:hypothetical protein